MCASEARAVGGMDSGAVVVLDAHSDNALRSLHARAHAGAVAAVDFFSPADDGVFASAGASDGLVKLWDTATASEAAALPVASAVGALAYCVRMRENLLLVGTSRGRSVVLDARSGASSHALAGHEGAVLSAAWSPLRAHEAATGGADGCVRLWDLRRAAAFVHSLDALDQSDARAQGKRQRLVGPQQAASLVRAHASRVVALDFALGGNDIVSLGAEGALRLWGRCAGSFRNAFADLPPVHGGFALGTRLALVPGCDCAVAVASGGAELCALALRSGELVNAGAGAGHTRRVAALACCEGGRVFSADEGGQLLVWDCRDDDDGDDGDDGDDAQMRHDGDAWSDA